MIDVGFEVENKVKPWCKLAWAAGLQSAGTIKTM